MKKKSFLKQIGKDFKFVGTTLMIAASVLLGHKALVLKDYAPQNQIKEIANGLDCDLDYFEFNSFKKAAALEHNGDEPIYISFSDEMTDIQKETVTQTLDYMFKIVGQINDNYQYEIVDQSTAKKKNLLGKTVINYEVAEDVSSSSASTIGNVQATATSSFDPISVMIGKPIIPRATITLDNKDWADGDSGFSVYLHELYHTFGVRDIYLSDSDVNKEYNNTFINNAIDNFNYLSPNDFKCLVSVYSEKMNEDELKEHISQYKQICEEYESFYYTKLVEHLKNEQVENYNLVNQDSPVEKDTYFKDIGEDFTICQIKTGKRYKSEGLGQVSVDTYIIKVKDGRYYFTVKDLSGNIICQETGIADYVDGAVVLKDLNLDTTLNPYRNGLPENGGIYNPVVFLNQNGEYVFTEMFSQTNDNFDAISEGLEDDFKNAYFKQEVQTIKEKHYNSVWDKDVEIDEYFKNIESKNLSLTYEIKVGSDGKGKFKYFIDVKDGKYNHTQTDETGKILNQCKGEAIFVDGCLVYFTGDKEPQVIVLDKNGQYTLCQKGKVSFNRLTEIQMEEENENTK